MMKAGMARSWERTFHTGNSKNKNHVVGSRYGQLESERMPV